MSADADRGEFLYATAKILRALEAIFEFVSFSVSMSFLVIFFTSFQTKTYLHFGSIISNAHFV
jgi:hypothetical protein